jgi:hypothetical protein
VTHVRIVIHDETYLTLDAVAECYECEIEWIERIYALGLLGRGEQVEGRTAIPSRMLERVAQIRRLCHHHGIDPAVVDLLLGEE